MAKLVHQEGAIRDRLRGSALAQPEMRAQPLRLFHMSSMPVKGSMQTMPVEIPSSLNVRAVVMALSPTKEPTSNHSGGAAPKTFSTVFTMPGVRWLSGYRD